MYAITFEPIIPPQIEPEHKSPAKYRTPTRYMSPAKHKSANKSKSPAISTTTDPSLEDPYIHLRQAMREELAVIKKVRLVTIATFALLFTAFSGTVAAIITFKITALTLVGAGMAILVTALALFALGKRHQRIISEAQENLERCANQIINQENGHITNEKINFFRIYGKYCKNLELGLAFEAETDLKSFFEEIMIKLTPDLRAIMEKIVGQEKGLEQIHISSLQKCLREFTAAIKRITEAPTGSDQESAINSAVKKCIEKAKGKAGEPAMTQTIVPDEKIAQIIRSCPNLERIHLGYCFTREILRACPQKIKVRMFEIDAIYQTFVKEYFKNRK